MTAGVAILLRFCCLRSKGGSCDSNSGEIKERLIKVTFSNFNKGKSAESKEGMEPESREVAAPISTLVSPSSVTVVLAVTSNDKAAPLVFFWNEAGGEGACLPESLSSKEPLSSLSLFKLGLSAMFQVRMDTDNCCRNTLLPSSMTFTSCFERCGAASTSSRGKGYLVSMLRNAKSG